MEGLAQNEHAFMQMTVRDFKLKISSRQLILDPSDEYIRFTAQKASPDLVFIKFENLHQTQLIHVCFAENLGAHIAGENVTTPDLIEIPAKESRECAFRIGVPDFGVYGSYMTVRRQSFVSPVLRTLPEKWDEIHMPLIFEVNAAKGNDQLASGVAKSVYVAGVPPVASNSEQALADLQELKNMVALYLPKSPQNP